MASFETLKRVGFAALLTGGTLGAGGAVAVSQGYELDDKGVFQVTQFNDFRSTELILDYPQPLQEFLFEHGSHFEDGEDNALKLIKARGYFESLLRNFPEGCSIEVLMPDDDVHGVKDAREGILEVRGSERWIELRYVPELDLLNEFTVYLSEKEVRAASQSWYSDQGVLGIMFNSDGTPTEKKGHLRFGKLLDSSLKET